MTYHHDVTTTPSRHHHDALLRLAPWAGKGIKENINNSCEDEPYADGRGISSSKGGTYFSSANATVLFCGGITPAARPFQITFLLLPL